MAYVWHRVPCCRTTWNSKHLKNENDSQELRLIVTYNIVNTSEPTYIYGYYVGDGFSILGVDMFDKVEIDGTEVSVASLDTTEGKYQLSIGEHIIAYTLKDPTTISVAAFYQCSSLTSVYIPNSVTSIGNGAFNFCSNLTSIDIPNSVTSIGDNAFQLCRSLTSVNIPSGVTSIGNSTFANCSGLTSINIPNNVTSIGDNAFSWCTSLTSIDIPNSVTSIINAAFYNCTSLTSCTIGSGVTLIGTNAFYNCTSLTSIISNATTAPAINGSTFQNIKTNGTLYVPQGSSGYDVWIGTGNYYLGKYGWTKVEQ